MRSSVSLQLGVGVCVFYIIRKILQLVQFCPTNRWSQFHHLKPYKTDDALK